MTPQLYQFLKSMTLEQKIEKTKDILRVAYNKYDNLYISTGGVDSTVLHHIASELPFYDNVDRVCIGSLEPYENTILNKERGDIILNTPMSKKDVIIKYGYPIVSKDVAMKVSRYLHSKKDWARQRRLEGYMGYNGKWCYASMIPKKWQFLIYAPFELSEKCCDISKKKPLKQYEKNNNSIPITGELAEESKDRLMTYLKNGCFHDGKRVKITPLAFWTEQDIKEYLLKYKKEYSSAYGEIIDNNGILEFTKEKRTGCDICGFGLQYDIERFERIKLKNEKLYNHIMYGGEWVRKDIYRWVKFRRNSIPIWSNLYFVPNKQGYGYKFVIDYIFN